MAADLLHLTLVFLGPTDARRVPEITSRLAEVATRHQTFEVHTGAAGGHVDDRPGARRGGVAWLTLAGGGRETIDLSLDIDAALESRTYDARRRQRPHLTVARNVDQAALQALSELAPRLALHWQQTRIVLFRSHTGPSGSRYEELTSHNLSGTH
jgi:2'-5' RNA ligase